MQQREKRKAKVEEREQRKGERKQEQVEKVNYISAATKTTRK